MANPNDCPPAGTIPDPFGCSRAQAVRLCNTTNTTMMEGSAAGVAVPTQFSIVYDPANDITEEKQQWLVNGVWVDTAPAGWSFGPPPSTVKIDSENIVLDGCANGVYIPTRFVAQYNEAGVKVGEEQQWLGASGWTTTTPAGWTVGKCPVVIVPNDIKVYMAESDKALSIPDIVAASSASKLLSLTVKQVSGVGIIKGDSGANVNVDVNEVWSWSAGNNNIDTLSNSSLVMDATGGLQRITATYI